RIEQLVREMDAAERLELGQRFLPGHHSAEIPQRFLLALRQNGKRLDDPIPKRSEEIRPALAHRSQNIPGEITLVRSLLDNDTIVRPAPRFPHLGELRRPDPAEQRTDADVGKITSLSAAPSWPGSGSASIFGRWLPASAKKPQRSTSRSSNKWNRPASSWITMTRSLARSTSRTGRPSRTTRSRVISSTPWFPWKTTSSTSTAATISWASCARP